MGQIGSNEIEWRTACRRASVLRPDQHFLYASEPIWPAPPGGKTVNPVVYGGEPGGTRSRSRQGRHAAYLPDTPAVPGNLADT